MRIYHYGTVSDPITAAFEGSPSFRVMNASWDRVSFLNPATAEKFEVFGTSLSYDPVTGAYSGTVTKVLKFAPDTTQTVEMDSLNVALADFMAAIQEIGESGARSKFDALINRAGYLDVNVRTASTWPGEIDLDLSGITSRVHYNGGNQGENIILGAGGYHRIELGAGDTTVSGTGSGQIFSGAGTNYLNLTGGAYEIYGNYLSKGGDLVIDFGGSATGMHRVWFNGVAVVDSAAGVIAQKGEGTADLTIKNFNALLQTGGLILHGTHDDDIHVSLLEGDELTFVGGEFSKRILVEGAGHFHLDRGIGDAVFVDLASGVLKTSEVEAKIINTGSTLLEISGSFSADTFVGSKRDEIFNPRFGNDTIDGGGGFDVVQYLNAVDVDNSARGVNVNLREGIAQFSGLSFVQSIKNIEGAVGTRESDSLVGDQFANTLSGAGGDDRIYGIGPFVAGDPGLSSFLYRVYLAALGRQPDVVGYDDWMARLKSGWLSQADVVDWFSESQEFMRDHNSLDDVSYITRLYQTVLQRAPDHGGLSDWLSKMQAGMTKGEILLNFVNAPEFVTASVAGVTEFVYRQNAANISDDIYRLYRATLDRDPDLGGFQDWLVLLQRGMPFEQAARIFIGSPEFQQRYGALSDGDFIDLLYANVLGRAPDAEGRPYWLDQLAGGVQREAVVLGFSQSTEFARETAEGMRGWMMSTVSGDTLSGGVGNDQLWGSAASDVFVFKATDTGTDRLHDFETWDKLSFEGFGFETVAELRAALSQTDQGAQFSREGVVFTLLDVDLAALRDDNFLI